MEESNKTKNEHLNDFVLLEEEELIINNLYILLTFNKNNKK